MSQQPNPLGRLLEGRDEPILDPDLPIIDTHHHFYDRPTVRYMFEDYLADVQAGHNIVASVYVETQAMARIDGPEILRPLGEVEFANGMAAMSASGQYGDCRIAAAIVGYADISAGAGVGELLDRSLSAAPDRLRGIRHVTMESEDPAPYRYFIMKHRPRSGLLTDPTFHEGFRELAKRELSFDAAVFHPQLDDLGRLADAFPDTTIILDLLGLALNLDKSPEEREEVRHAWAAGLRRLAQRPNVVCKIGGLGLPFWGFGFDTREEPVGYQDLAPAWAPYIETAVEAFGADRCMMGSNYPPDARSAGFVPLWNALKYVVRDYSASEKAALFHDTAARVYRIPPR
jgi:predicted TIM-barrel fold metal-dependent hydrolase